MNIIVIGPAIELGLRRMVALELFRDRASAAPQLFHDGFEPGLIVAANPLSHRGRVVRVSVKNGRALSQINCDYAVLAVPATLLRRMLDTRVAERLSEAPSLRRTGA